MKVYKIDNMMNGWFIGNFFPSVLKTSDVEVAVKKYVSGAREKIHYHKIATEVTLIVDGEIEMNNVKYSSGDILVIFPKETADFKAITNVINVVVKIPSASNDKFEVV